MTRAGDRKQAHEGLPKPPLVRLFVAAVLFATVTACREGSRGPRRRAAYFSGWER
jgi:hypothetical protein